MQFLLESLGAPLYYVRLRAGAFDRLACGARTLERACKARYGRTPKRIAQGYRAVATLFRERDEGGRPELHAEFAYADLPHSSKDLRRIRGLTRTQNLAQMERDETLPIPRHWLDGRTARTDAEKQQWHADHARQFDLAIERTLGIRNPARPGPV